MVEKAINKLFALLTRRCCATTFLLDDQVKLVEASTREEIVRGLIWLLNNARKEILIVTGELLGDLYNQKDVIEALTRARKRGVRLEILVGPGFDKNSDFVKQFADFIFVLNNYPVLHFAVVDSRHVRIEPPHEAGKLPPNTLAKNVPYTAGKLKEMFEELRSKAKPLRETSN